MMMILIQPIVEMIFIDRCRLGRLLNNFELFVPVLSDAEVSWKKELTEVNKSMELLRSKLTKVSATITFPGLV